MPKMNIILLLLEPNITAHVLHQKHGILRKRYSFYEVSIAFYYFLQ